MKVLVVYAHPSPESFNHAVLESVKEGLSEAGHTYDVIDLYEMNFDPCLRVEDFVKINSGTNSDDVLSHQERVSKADVLVFIHPYWWGGTPAILKGWIDRIFSMNYAYKTDEETGGIMGLLKAKKSLVLSTCGSPKESSVQSGSFAAFKEIWSQKIIQFCGIPDVHIKLFYDVIMVDDETRKKYLEEARDLARKL
jgi:NAD(P)H dehydrogenase (quinone)